MICDFVRFCKKAIGADTGDSLSRLNRVFTSGQHRGRCACTCPSDCCRPRRCHRVGASPASVPTSARPAALACCRRGFSYACTIETHICIWSSSWICPRPRRPSRRRCRSLEGSSLPRRSARLWLRRLRVAGSC